MNAPLIDGHLVVGYSHFGGSNGKQVITHYVDATNIDPEMHARQTPPNSTRTPEWIEYFSKKPMEGDASRMVYTPVAGLPTYFIDATIIGTAFAGYDLVELRGGRNTVTIAEGSLDRVLLSLN